MIVVVFKLVKMENPYTEPQKRCVLCNVTVDFKNTQVSQGSPAAQREELSCTWESVCKLDPIPQRPLFETQTFPCLSWFQLLSQFISPYTGRIYGRHVTGEQLVSGQRSAGSEAENHLLCFTGLCGRKQKEVSKAIKKAHSLGTLAYLVINVWNQV